MSADGQQIDLSKLSREELERRYMLLQTEYNTVEAKMNWYLEQYRLSMQKRYGKSSESDISGQLSLSDLPLFNEAEAFREPLNIEPDLEKVISKQSQKKSKHRGNKKDLKNIPVETTVYTLSGKELLCPNCGNELKEMKEEVQTVLEVIPAQVKVHKHVIKHYSCRACAKNKKSSIVKASGAPLKIIPKSIASPSLMADIISKKYVDATPFYRQEQNFKRRSIPVTRNNMCNWSIDVSKMYFAPLVSRMKEIMFAEGVIHCDETYTEVLFEPDRPTSCKSYIWVTTTAEYQKSHPIAIYNYREGRSAIDAKAVLKGFSGYIMCDGYDSYGALQKKGKDGSAPMNVTLVACMVHVRRKFADALKLIPEKDRKGTSAQKAIDMIATITHVDNKFKDLPRDERKEMRIKAVKPLMEAFFAWILEESKLALPKSKYGQAVEYALNQKEKVMNVFLDGRLELTNNMAERTVKPFVIGRKNWLFSNTPAGADASCILYSIVETAKLNDLIPFEYIKYVLEQYPKEREATKEEIENLLPWSKTIPDYVKNPKEE